MGFFNKKQDTSKIDIRREGRSHYGLAWHIQANPGTEDLKALCGYEMLNLSNSQINITPEYLIDLVENRKAEHEGFFYCGKCYQELTGRERPKIK